MRVFFDTEFTGLYKNTTLISIGFISDSNYRFYAEFKDFDQLAAYQNDWIRENVLPKLKKGETKLEGRTWYIYGTKEEVKQALIKWFSRFEKVELYADVGYYDMVLFIDIFGTSFDLPKQVSPVYHDINTDLARYLKISESEAFDINREEFIGLKAKDVESGAHNALWDAIITKRVYEKIMSKNKRGGRKKGESKDKK